MSLIRDATRSNPDAAPAVDGAVRLDREALPEVDRRHHRAEVRQEVKKDEERKDNLVHVLMDSGEMSGVATVLIKAKPITVSDDQRRRQQDQERQDSVALSESAKIKKKKLSGIADQIANVLLSLGYDSPTAARLAEAVASEVSAKADGASARQVAERIAQKLFNALPRADILARLGVAASGDPAKAAEETERAVAKFADLLEGIVEAEFARQDEEDAAPDGQPGGSAMFVSDEVPAGGTPPVDREIPRMPVSSATVDTAAVTAEAAKLKTSLESDLSADKADRIVAAYRRVCETPADPRTVEAVATRFATDVVDALGPEDVLRRLKVTYPPELAGRTSIRDFAIARTREHVVGDLRADSEQVQRRHKGADLTGNAYFGETEILLFRSKVVLLVLVGPAPQPAAANVDVAPPPRPVAGRGAGGTAVREVARDTAVRGTGNDESLRALEDSLTNLPDVGADKARQIVAHFRTLVESGVDPATVRARVTAFATGLVETMGTRQTLDLFYVAAADLVGKDPKTVAVERVVACLLPTLVESETAAGRRPAPAGGGIRHYNDTDVALLRARLVIEVFCRFPPTAATEATVPAVPMEPAVANGNVAPPPRPVTGRGAEGGTAIRGVARGTEVPESGIDEQLRALEATLTNLPDIGAEKARRIVTHFRTLVESGVDPATVRTRAAAFATSFVEILGTQQTLDLFNVPAADLVGKDPKTVAAERIVACILPTLEESETAAARRPAPPGGGPRHYNETDVTLLRARLIIGVIRRVPTVAEPVVPAAAAAAIPPAPAAVPVAPAPRAIVPVNFQGDVPARADLVHWARTFAENLERRNGFSPAHATRMAFRVQQICFDRGLDGANPAMLADAMFDEMGRGMLAPEFIGRMGLTFDPARRDDQVREARAIFRARMIAIFEENRTIMTDRADPTAPGADTTRAFELAQPNPADPTRYLPCRYNATDRDRLVLAFSTAFSADPRRPVAFTFPDPTKTRGELAHWAAKTADKFQRDCNLDEAAATRMAWRYQQIYLDIRSGTVGSEALSLALADELAGSISREEFIRRMGGTPSTNLTTQDEQLLAARREFCRRILPTIERMNRAPPPGANPNGWADLAALETAFITAIGVNPTRAPSPAPAPAGAPAQPPPFVPMEASEVTRLRDRIVADLIAEGTDSDRLRFWVAFNRTEMGDAGWARFLESYRRQYGRPFLAEVASIIELNPSRGLTLPHNLFPESEVAIYVESVVRNQVMIEAVLGFDLRREDDSVRSRQVRLVQIANELNRRYGGGGQVSSDARPTLAADATTSILAAARARECGNLEVQNRITVLNAEYATLQQRRAAAEARGADGTLEVQRINREMRQVDASRRILQATNLAELERALGDKFLAIDERIENGDPGAQQLALESTAIQEFIMTLADAGSIITGLTAATGVDEVQAARVLCVQSATFRRDEMIRVNRALLIQMGYIDTAGNPTDRFRETRRQVDTLITERRRVADAIGTPEAREGLASLDWMGVVARSDFLVSQGRFREAHDVVKRFADANRGTIAGYEANRYRPLLEDMMKMHEAAAELADSARRLETYVDGALPVLVRLWTNYKDGGRATNNFLDGIWRQHDAIAARQRNVAALRASAVSLSDTTRADLQKLYFQSRFGIGGDGDRAYQPGAIGRNFNIQRTRSLNETHAELTRQSGMVRDAVRGGPIPLGHNDALTVIEGRRAPSLPWFNERRSVALISPPDPFRPGDSYAVITLQPAVIARFEGARSPADVVAILNRSTLPDPLLIRVHAIDRYLKSAEGNAADRAILEAAVERDRSGAIIAILPTAERRVIDLITRLAGDPHALTALDLCAWGHGQDALLDRWIEAGGDNARWRRGVVRTIRSGDLAELRTFVAQHPSEAASLGLLTRVARPAAQLDTVLASLTPADRSAVLSYYRTMTGVQLLDPSLRSLQDAYVRCLKNGDRATAILLLQVVGESPAFESIRDSFLPNLPETDAARLAFYGRVVDADHAQIPEVQIILTELDPKLDEIAQTRAAARLALPFRTAGGSHFSGEFDGGGRLRGLTRQAAPPGTTPYIHDPAGDGIRTASVNRLTTVSPALATRIGYERLLTALVDERTAGHQLALADPAGKVNLTFTNVTDLLRAGRWEDATDAVRYANLNPAEVLLLRERLDRWWTENRAGIPGVAGRVFWCDMANPAVTALLSGSPAEYDQARVRALLAGNNEVAFIRYISKLPPEQSRPLLTGTAIPAGWTQARDLVTAVNANDRALIEIIGLRAELTVGPDGRPGISTSREVMLRLINGNGDPARSAEYLAALVRAYNARYGANALSTDLLARFPAAQFGREQELLRALGSGERLAVATEIMAYAARIEDRTPGDGGKHNVGKFDYLFFNYAARFARGDEIVTCVRSLDARIGEIPGEEPGRPRLFWLLKLRAADWSIAQGQWDFITMVRMRGERPVAACLALMVAEASFTESLLIQRGLREEALALRNQWMGAANDQAASARRYEAEINATHWNPAWGMNGGEDAARGLVRDHGYASGVARSHANLVNERGVRVADRHIEISRVRVIISMRQLSEGSELSLQRGSQLIGQVQQDTKVLKHTIAQIPREPEAWKDAMVRLQASQARWADYQRTAGYWTAGRDLLITIGCSFIPYAGLWIGFAIVTYLRVSETMRTQNVGFWDAVYINRYYLAIDFALTFAFFLRAVFRPKHVLDAHVMRLEDGVWHFGDRVGRRVVRGGQQKVTEAADDLYAVTLKARPDEAIGIWIRPVTQRSGLALPGGGDVDPITPLKPMPPWGLDPWGVKPKEEEPQLPYQPHGQQRNPPHPGFGIVVVPPVDGQPPQVFLQLPGLPPIQLPPDVLDAIRNGKDPLDALRQFFDPPGGPNAPGIPPVLPFGNPPPGGGFGPGNPGGPPPAAPGVAAGDNNPNGDGKDKPKNPAGDGNLGDFFGTTPPGIGGSNLANSGSTLNDIAQAVLRALLGYTWIPGQGIIPGTQIVNPNGASPGTGKGGGGDPDKPRVRDVPPPGYSPVMSSMNGEQGNSMTLAEARRLREQKEAIRQQREQLNGLTVGVVPSALTISSVAMPVGAAATGVTISSANRHSQAMGAAIVQSDPLGMLVTPYANQNAAGMTQANSAAYSHAASVQNAIASPFGAVTYQQNAAMLAARQPNGLNDLVFGMASSVNHTANTVSSLATAAPAAQSFSMYQATPATNGNSVSRATNETLSTPAARDSNYSTPSSLLKAESKAAKAAEPAEVLMKSVALKQAPKIIRAAEVETKEAYRDSQPNVGAKEKTLEQEANKNAELRNSELNDSQNAPDVTLQQESHISGADDSNGTESSKVSESADAAARIIIANQVAQASSGQSPKVGHTFGHPLDESVEESDSILSGADANAKARNAKKRAQEKRIAQQKRMRDLITAQLTAQKLPKAVSDRLLRMLLDLGISEVEYRQLVAQLGQQEVQTLVEEVMQPVALTVDGEKVPGGIDSAAPAPKETSGPAVETKPTSTLKRPNRTRADLYRKLKERDKMKSQAQPRRDIPQ